MLSPWAYLKNKQNIAILLKEMTENWDLVTKSKLEFGISQ